MDSSTLDPQKEAIYAWEDTFRSFGERSLTQRETRRVIRRCCRLYGVRAPAVRFLPKNRVDDSYWQQNTIWMSWRQCNHAVACHEAAHHIIESWQDEDEDEPVEDHGPEFMGVYLALLIVHRVASRIALEASLRQAGIRWITN